MMNEGIARALFAFTFAVNCLHASGFQQAFVQSRSTKVIMRNSQLTMDMEGDSIDRSSRIKIREQLFTSSHSSKSQRLPLSHVMDHEEAIRHAESKVAMPWAISIQPEAPLLYMPFWEWQLSYMKKTLTNLRVMPIEEKFVYNENLKKKARIVNLCFRSDEYRKIRMTYYDAGEGCQVFNSLWYPDAKYNLPVLGIDLLAFGRKKYLAVVDFQPIHDNEDMHTLAYEHILAPIKSVYPSLKGKMSSKFYDETKFFSQEMLFARFENESVVEDELMDAFQKYVQVHTQLIRDCPVDDSVDARFKVLERHAAYDTYSADRDPAVGLFAAMFGKEWADEFVHDFLFSLSDKKEQSPVVQAEIQSTTAQQCNAQNSVVPVASR